MVEIDKFQEKVLKLNQDFKFVLLSNIFNKTIQTLVQITLSASTKL